MLGAIPAALGVIAAGRRLLVSPGALGGGVFSRASSGLALGADGTTWGGVAANLPRFHGTARRLLIEGQRTNYVRNPRCEGATLGNAGASTLPTNWGLGSGHVTGVTRSVVGTGQEGGLDYVDIRMQGTAAAAGLVLNLAFEGNTTGVPVTAGQIATASVFLRLVSGTLPSGTKRMLVQGRGTTSSAMGSASIAPTGAGLATQVCTAIGTANAGNDFAQPTVQFNAALNEVVDFTIRIGAPQAELAAFASSPMLPPVGSPAATTRSRDTFSTPVASQAGTLLLSGMVPAIGGIQTLGQVDDGTASNRYVLRFDGTTALNLTAVATGAATGTLSLGPITPGTPFKAGMAWNGTAGRVAAVGPSGSVVVQTGGPASGLTTLRLGDDAAGGSTLFGEVARAEVLSYALSDAALAARVAALP